MDHEPILALSVEQAAQILGIGRSTAYELVHTGEIPSIRYGTRIVIPTYLLAEQLHSPVEQIFHLADRGHDVVIEGNGPSSRVVRLMEHDQAG